MHPFTTRNKTGFKIWFSTDTEHSENTRQRNPQEAKLSFCFSHLNLTVKRASDRAIMHSSENSKKWESVKHRAKEILILPPGLFLILQLPFLGFFLSSLATFRSKAKKKPQYKNNHLRNFTSVTEVTKFCQHIRETLKFLRDFVPLHCVLSVIPNWLSMFHNISVKFWYTYTRTSLQSRTN